MSKPYHHRLFQEYFLREKNLSFEVLSFSVYHNFREAFHSIVTNSVKNDHSRFLAIMNSLGDSALSHNLTHRLGRGARVSENYLRETFHSAMTNSVKTLAQDSSGRRRLSTRWKQSPREPSFTIPRDDDFTDRLCPTSQPHTPPRISGNYDRRLPMSVCGHRTPQSSHCARDTTRSCTNFAKCTGKCEITIALGSGFAIFGQKLQAQDIYPAVA